MVKLNDVIAMVNKEQGFYLRSAHLCELGWQDFYYQDADDFYESPESNGWLEKELYFISTIGDKILLIIE